MLGLSGQALLSPCVYKHQVRVNNFPNTWSRKEKINKHQIPLFLAEMFQLVAINLPQSREQVVDAKDMSAVLSDVGSEPAAIAIGREVGAPD